MSEPNERDIEKLLRSAGAKRRGRAGTPAMHPATREMLQTEVRRQYGAGSAPARPGFSGLLRWLPRVAVFVVLGVSAWLLWVQDPGVDSSSLAMKDEAALSPASEEERLREAGTASVPEAAPPELEPDSGDAADRKPAPITLAMKQSRPAVAPVASPGRKVDSAADAQQVARSVVGTDYFKSDRQAMYMGMAAAGSEDKVAGGGNRDTDMKISTESRSAARSGGSAERVASALISPGAGAVFQNFTVFNTGNLVRVVDADGSTYLGTLQPMGAEWSGERDARSDGASMAPKEAFGDAVAADLSLVRYRLVATGTNRSLGRPVLFNGQLELTEQQMRSGRNVFSNTVLQTSGEKAKRLSASPNQSPPGRLQGKAVLSEGEEVAVDAVLSPR